METILALPTTPAVAFQVGDIVYNQPGSQYAAIGRIVAIRESGDLILKDDVGNKWIADPSKCWLAR